MKEDFMTKNGNKESNSEIVLTPFSLENGKLDFGPLSDPRFNTYSFESKDLENRSTLCYSLLQDSVMEELHRSSDKFKLFREQSNDTTKSTVKDEIKEEYSQLVSKYSSELYKEDEFTQEKILPELRNVLEDKDETVINKNAENHLRRKNNAKFVKENILINPEELPKEQQESFKNFLLDSGAMEKVEDSVPLDTYMQWAMAHKINTALEQFPTGTKFGIIGPGTDPNFTKDKIVDFNESSGEISIKNKPNAGSTTPELTSKGYDTSKMNTIMAATMLMGVKPQTKSEFRDMSKDTGVTFFEPEKVLGENFNKKVSMAGFCGTEQGLLFGLGLPIGKEPLHGGDISNPAESRLVKYSSLEGKSSEPIHTNCEHNYFIYCSQEKQNELKNDLLSKKSGIYIASSAGEGSFEKDGKPVKVAIDYLQHNAKNNNREVVDLEPNAMVHSALMVRESELVSIVLQDHRDGINVNSPNDQKELFEIMKDFNANPHIDLEERISTAVKSLENNTLKQKLNELLKPSVVLSNKSALEVSTRPAAKKRENKNKSHQIH